MRESESNKIPEVMNHSNCNFFQYELPVVWETSRCGGQGNSPKDEEDREEDYCLVCVSEQHNGGVCRQIFQGGWLQGDRGGPRVGINEGRIHFFCS